MSKDGKQINFILEQIQTNDSLTAYSEVYHFKPAIEELKKKITLKVTGGTDINATLERLGLPYEHKGDLVTIEIGVKEVQSKLIKEEETKEEEETDGQTTDN